MPPKAQRPASDKEAGRAPVERTGQHDPNAGPATDAHQNKEEPPRIGQITSLDELPAVRAYLTRIGAKAVNFQRAKIEVTEDGYPRTVGQVRIDAKGDVKVTGKAKRPTDAEADAIKEAFKHVKLPTLVPLAKVTEPPKGVSLSDPGAFLCHDFDGRVVMIHQRFETKDGGKGFIPWTRWSDGQWHQMEPEVMPFWGLPGAKEHTTLYLHEGAKAARRVKEMIDGEREVGLFPWLEELRWGAHVGWIGGVHAIDRSDWAKLVAMGWKRIVIVADNDYDGKGLKAARRIAEQFSTNVWILAFDQRFPDGFDLADEWPADQFDKQQRYIGPSMRDCLLPATWATIELPPEGRGRPTRILREEYAALIAYTADPPRIMFRSHPSRDMRPETFNIKAAPFSHAKDTAVLVWRHLSCQHEKMVYRPDARPGTLNIDGVRGFNVYEGANITPVKDGDPELWLGFLRHLFPVPSDRELVMRWLATLIAKPEVRMHYGMLLISGEQGVGKNTLGNILRLLLGRHNVSFPSEISVVKSDFNGWLARKRLIFISEFYSGHSRKAYDKIKPYITEDEVEINEKGVNQYEIDNYAHFIACSNSEKALHLDDEDRRWMVPTVTERKQPDTYWRELYAWLAADGPGIILQWALDFGSYERTGAEAPISERKQVIIDESRSDGKKLARSLGEWMVGRDKMILRLTNVREWIAAKRSLDLADYRLEGGSTVTAVLKKVPGITVWADKKRPKFGMHNDTVIMNFDPGPEARWEEIKHHLTDFQGAQVDADEPM